MKTMDGFVLETPFITPPSKLCLFMILFVKYLVRNRHVPS